MTSVPWRALPRAWRVLRDGVCDGCSLGPYGLRDNVMPGLHLCRRRLEQLRPPARMPLDASALTELTGTGTLGAAGPVRLEHPLLRGPGEAGFRRVSWDEALDRIAERLQGVPGERMGFIASARDLTNETAWLLQKAARLLGSSHVDLWPRADQAVARAALAQMLGVGASTCSLRDLAASSLIVLCGADPARDQPVLLRYLRLARRRGARVVSVNPAPEAGLGRPGRAPLDLALPLKRGGDVGLLSGTLRRLLELGGQDRAFIAARTRGFEALASHLARLDWAALESRAGLGRAAMDRLARELARAPSAVLVCGTGLAREPGGVDGVKALVNLALATGSLGRPGSGVLALHRHPAAQGAADCGLDPGRLPGGAPVDSEVRARFERAWGRELPREPGIDATAQLDAARTGRLELLYLLGGKLLRAHPDRVLVREALERVPVRVHQLAGLDDAALGPGELVVLLPELTRHEQRGGGTTTSVERRVRFSPQIECGPGAAEALPAWEIPCRVARRVRPELAPRLDPTDAGAVRREIGGLVPAYRGVERLERAGDWIQWGGERLCSSGFPDMPEGRARFAIVPLARRTARGGGPG